MIRYFTSWQLWNAGSVALLQRTIHPMRCGTVDKRCKAPRYSTSRSCQPMGARPGEKRDKSVNSFSFGFKRIHPNHPALSARLLPIPCAQRECSNSGRPPHDSITFIGNYIKRFSGPGVSSLVPCKQTQAHGHTHIYIYILRNRYTLVQRVIGARWKHKRRRSNV